MPPSSLVYNELHFFCVTQPANFYQSPKNKWILVLTNKTRGSAMIFGQGTTLDTGQVTQLFGHVTIVLPLIFGHIPQQHHGILGSNLEYHENNISELWYISKIVVPDTTTIQWSRFFKRYHNWSNCWESVKWYRRSWITEGFGGKRFIWRSIKNPRGN